MESRRDQDDRERRRMRRGGLIAGAVLAGTILASGAGNSTTPSSTEASPNWGNEQGQQEQPNEIKTSTTKILEGASLRESPDEQSPIVDPYDIAIQGRTFGHTGGIVINNTLVFEIPVNGKKATWLVVAASENGIRKYVYVKETDPNVSHSLDGRYLPVTADGKGGFKAVDNNGNKIPNDQIEDILILEPNE